MSKDRLLIDEELKENIITFLLGEKYKNKYGLLSDTEKHHVDYLIDLINTQKRLYAKSIIGEDEPIQPNSVKLTAKERYSTFRRNELRAEQRARIK